MGQTEMELAEATEIIATANATMRAQRQEIAKLKEQLEALAANGTQELMAKLRQAEARATSMGHLLREKETMVRRLQREVDSRDARIDELFRMVRLKLHIRNANVGAVENSPDYKHPIITCKSKAHDAEER